MIKLPNEADYDVYLLEEAMDAIVDFSDEEIVRLSERIGACVTVLASKLLEVKTDLLAKERIGENQ